MNERLSSVESALDKERAKYEILNELVEEVVDIKKGQQKQLMFYQASEEKISKIAKVANNYLEEEQMRQQMLESRRRELAKIDEEASNIVLRFTEIQNRPVGFPEKYTLVSENRGSSALFSSALGAGTALGAAQWSVSSLYTTTAKASEMIKYADGTVGSILKDSSGKIIGHAGFSPATLLSLSPMIAFQFMTIMTSMVYMAKINEQLVGVNKKFDRLFRFHENERIGKLGYYIKRIEELDNQDYFTPEDFLLIKIIHRDLGIIAEEAELNFYVVVEEFYSYPLFKEYVKECKEREKEKEEKEPGLWESAKNLPKAGIEYLKEKFRDSQLEAINTMSELGGLRLLTYAEISLIAEKLSNYLLLIELKANSRVRELTSDRLGKIEYLKNNLSVRVSTKHRSALSDEIDVLDPLVQGFIEKNKKAKKEKKAKPAKEAPKKDEDKKKKKKSKKEEKQETFDNLIKDYNEQKNRLDKIFEGAHIEEEIEKLSDSFKREFEIVIDRKEDREVVYMKAR